MLSAAVLVASLALAVLRFLLQGELDPNSLTFTGMILYVALPGLAGYVATFLYSGIKTILPFYDNLDAKVHQILAPVFAFLFGFFVIGKLGLTAIGDVHTAGLDWYLGATTTLMQAGVFRFFKRKAPVDATVALKASRESKAL
jgi:quinol-cytochrome oxidoreductase complex cytochrome b subunit